MVAGLVELWGTLVQELWKALECAPGDAALLEMRIRATEPLTSEQLCQVCPIYFSVFKQGQLAATCINAIKAAG